MNQSVLRITWPFRQRKESGNKNLDMIGQFYQRSFLVTESLETSPGVVHSVNAHGGGNSQAGTGEERGETSQGGTEGKNFVSQWRIEV